MNNQEINKVIYKPKNNLELKKAVNIWCKKKEMLVKKNMEIYQIGIQY